MYREPSSTHRLPRTYQPAGTSFVLLSRDFPARPPRRYRESVAIGAPPPLLALHASRSSPSLAAIDYTPHRSRPPRLPSAADADADAPPRTPSAPVLPFCDDDLRRWASKSPAAQAAAAAAAAADLLPTPEKEAPAAKRGARRPRVPAASADPPRTPPTDTTPLPLSPLLKGLAEESFDVADPARTSAVLKLFLRHELAMQVAQANADGAAAPRRPPSPTKKKGAAGGNGAAKARGRDRLLVEREEIASRRRLVMRPQSLTYS